MEMVEALEGRFVSGVVLGKDIESNGDACKV